MVEVSKLFTRLSRVTFYLRDTTVDVGNVCISACTRGKSASECIFVSPEGYLTILLRNIFLFHNIFWGLDWTLN